MRLSMRWIRKAVGRVLGAVVIGALVAGCTLPRSGPTAGEILGAEAAEGSDVLVVPVTPAIARIVRPAETLAFGRDFVSAGTISADTIRAGDTLSVTVWENADTSLLAGAGERVTTLDALQVDESGEIFVPYAGRLRAAGRSPESLRQAITQALSAQTPEPQVEVRRIAGDGSTVSVLGEVNAPGVYPIEAPTRRLSAMLARAGGVSVVPDVAQVRIQRGGRNERIWLEDLYDTPAYDVAVRAGDRIVVEEDRRSFTALGATEGQARVNFNKRDMSALEAIAAAGGLDGRAADPTGVFVFRTEPPEIAGRVLGRGLGGPQQIAYVIDLTAPGGLFSARDFVIRDEDTIYITEAPFASWSRVLSVATTAVSLTGSAAAISRLD